MFWYRGHFSLKCVLSVCSCAYTNMTFVFGNLFFELACMRFGMTQMPSFSSCSVLLGILFVLEKKEHKFDLL